MSYVHTRCSPGSIGKLFENHPPSEEKMEALQKIGFSSLKYVMLTRTVTDFLEWITSIYNLETNEFAIGDEITLRLTKEDVQAVYDLLRGNEPVNVDELDSLTIIEIREFLEFIREEAVELVTGHKKKTLKLVEVQKGREEAVALVTGNKKKGSEISSSERSETHVLNQFDTGMANFCFSKDKSADKNADKSADNEILDVYDNESAEDYERDNVAKEDDRDDAAKESDTDDVAEENENADVSKKKKRDAAKAHYLAVDWNLIMISLKPEMGGPLCGSWTDDEVKNILGTVILKRSASRNVEAAPHLVGASCYSFRNVFPGILTEVKDKQNDELYSYFYLLVDLKRRYVACREMCDTSIETIDKTLNERQAACVSVNEDRFFHCRCRCRCPFRFLFLFLFHCRFRCPFRFVFLFLFIFRCHSLPLPLPLPLPLR
ncbi:hypothetical protein LINGRAHAP2_LOCUS1547 [Linum grandiflorum]